MSELQKYCLLISTHIIIYICGMMTKAYANYYGQLFTDKRKQREHKNKVTKLVKNLNSISPKFISELKIDIINDPHGYIRDIGIIHEAIPYSGNPMFRYSDEIYPEILNVLSLMESYEFVTNITANGSFPKYKMSEEFVELMKN